MPKNKRRYIKKQEHQQNIMQSTDPIEIAKHLMDVLEKQGYTGYSSAVDNLKHIDIWVYDCYTKPRLKISNVLADWEVKEND